MKSGPSLVLLLALVLIDGDLEVFQWTLSPISSANADEARIRSNFVAGNTQSRGFARKLFTSVNLTASNNPDSSARTTGESAQRRAGDAHSSDISPEDIISLRHIGGESGSLTVSPDGRHVAFQIQEASFVDRTYHLAWYVMPISGSGPAVRVGDGGELVLNPGPFGRINGPRADFKAEWSSDGSWIAYLRKEKGEVQVWRSRSDGSAQEQVTHATGDVISFKLTRDGTAMYFDVGRNRVEMEAAIREEGDKGYLLDDRFSIEYSTKPLWFPCVNVAWGVLPPPNQKCEIETSIVQFGFEERRASDVEQEEFAELISPRRPPKIDAARQTTGITWDSKSQHAAWFENEDPKINLGWSPPLVLFADNDRCSAPECSGKLQKAWWRGGEIIFFKYEGHSNSIAALYGWRPKSRHVRPIYRFDGTLESCEIAGSRAICLHETPRSPRKIVAINVSDGLIATVFDPNPTFSRFMVGDVERLEWKDRFDNDTFAHLVYPPGYVRGLRYPLVIVQYRSRGFLNGGIGAEYPIYPLAAQGFVVLSFDRPEDRRLETRYSVSDLASMGAFGAQQWKDGYTHRQALSALEIILDRLDERGIIDPSKVGITGLSNGAETIDFALFNSNRFAAAAMSGTWTPVYYSLTVNASMRAFLRAITLAGSASQAIENWAHLSMATNVEKVNTPLLIQVSDREAVSTVPAFVALRDAGKAVEAYVFPDEYHVKWQPQHKRAVADRAIDWFKFWLKGEEDLSPPKFEQYERWRELRVLTKDSSQGYRSQSH